MSELEPVTMMAATTRLDFEFTAGVAMSKNLHGYEQGKFIGQRCPKCKKVYIPSRGSCPTDGLPTDEIVELPNTGTVTTYCIVNVPFAGQSIEIPYICAQILLDGANLSFMGLHPGDPHRSDPHGPAGGGGVGGSRGPAGAVPGLSEVLPAQRRTRRRVRNATRSTCERLPRPARRARDRWAIASFAQYAERPARGRRAERGGDAHAGGGRGVRQHRHHQGRRRLHLLGLHRLPDRWAVQLRHGPRRRGGVAAPRSESTRGDGRGVGALRGVGAPAGGGDRRRSGLQPSAGRPSATWARSWPCSSTPTIWLHCGPTPPQPGRPAGPGPHRRGEGAPRPSSPRWPVAARSRKDALANPKAQVANDIARPEHPPGQEEYEVVSPLRRHTLPPITDGCRRHRAGRRGKAPTQLGRAPGLWITGFDHRMETHSPSGRVTSPPRRPPGQGRRHGWSGRRARRSTWPRSTRPFAPQEIIVRRGPGTRRVGDHVNPSGGAARRQPADVGRPHPDRRGRRAGPLGVRPGGAVAHATSGPCLQQNLVCVLEGA